MIIKLNYSYYSCFATDVCMNTFMRSRTSGCGSLMPTNNKMTAEYPEQSEYTFQGIKHNASYGARDMLILVSTAPEGGDVIARKNGELTKQDKEILISEGIPEDCWEND